MRGFTTVAAVAALFASTAVAKHKAVVHNMCAGDVYLWAVDASNCVNGAAARNPTEPTKIASGSAYREVMRQLVAGGVSLKLSQENDLYGAITQFEYTWDGKTWYDLSNVNCEGDECPFQAQGMYLESAPGCPTVTCSPGNLTCHQAYNNPNDNWASLCCLDGEPDVTLFLCADGPGEATPPSPPSPSSYSPSTPSSYSAPVVKAAEVQSAPKPTHYRPKPTPVNPATEIVEAAEVQSAPKPTHYRPKPTPVNPATQIVEVTQVRTVVVTVTPDANTHHRRHVHRHAH